MMGGYDSSLEEGLSYVVERVVDGIDDATVAGRVPGTASALADSAEAGGPAATSSPALPSALAGPDASWEGQPPQRAQLGGANHEAFKHFHLLALSAQMNLGGPPLDASRTTDLFARAVAERVPFHLWDGWVHAELARARFT